ncbi:hypothetical protein [Prauserella cavernicola]|uniref:Uncharacterized protein n=1 Tax=Prauserella cavernicola TaxID=2800127 RepID=A0A934QN83_9PSEU|nr:hypothetical protein [Prauserella cavernicola]MBK1785122.1 hypothetical protein [Prauserella cavernicola]
MTMWSLTVTAALDRAPSQHETMQLGREIAGEDLVMVGIQDNRVSCVVSSESVDGFGILQDVIDNYEQTMAHHGFTVLSWESAEVLSEAETQRRIEAAAIPAMVSATEFAELCGITKQRIYELETERKKTVEQGKTSRFPTPVVPGYWLRSAAEHYAKNRPRRPGRPRKDQP